MNWTGYKLSRIIAPEKIGATARATNTMLHLDVGVRVVVGRHIVRVGIKVVVQAAVDGGAGEALGWVEASGGERDIK